MKRNNTKCVFGPVPSRRLGMSLGIDLLPYKTCSMNCVYCECGATTRLTCERKEYFPTTAVIAELDTVLAARPKIDCATFSGVGEPTLHTGLGRIIRHLHDHYPQLKICLLTNASTLNDEAVLADLAQLDIVAPSLDGSTEEELRRINRPEPAVTLKTILAGLIRFRERYPDKTMWLEIFIVPGVNDSMEAAERFRALAAKIRPDKVQLNSLDRPGAAAWVRPADRGVLEQIAAVIGKSAPVEIVARPPRRPVRTRETASPNVEQYNELILKTLRSRPCTADDLASTLGIAADRIEPHLRRLERAGLLKSESGARGKFYRPA